LTSLSVFTLYASITYNVAIATSKRDPKPRKVFDATTRVLGAGNASPSIFFVAAFPGDTDIMVNSVVILFICDLDELLFDIVMTVGPDWAESSSYQAPVHVDMDEESEHEKIEKLDLKFQLLDCALEDQIQRLDLKFQTLDKNTEALMEQVMLLIDKMKI